MGGKWKQLKLWARDAKECFKQSLMGLSRKMLQSKNSREMQKVKMQLIKFQRGIKIKLLYTNALRTGVRQNSKLMDWFV